MGKAHIGKISLIGAIGLMTCLSEPAAARSWYGAGYYRPVPRVAPYRAWNHSWNRHWHGYNNAWAVPLALGLGALGAAAVAPYYYARPYPYAYAPPPAYYGPYYAPTPYYYGW